MMDSLDRLIQLSQIRGVMHTHCTLQGDWRLHHPESKNSGLFHIILRGSCLLLLREQKITLNRGDVFFLPQGSDHQIISNEKTRENNTALSPLTTRKQNHYTLVSNTAGDSNFEMFCGTFYYAEHAPLIDTLPEYVHLSILNTPIEMLIKLFALEENSENLGAKSIIDALSAVLFTYILRNYMNQSPDHQGLIAALQDKRLSPVITALIKDPAQDWNIDGLAALAHMSRANFIRVFQQKLAIPPGKFLTNLRMQQAGILLQTTRKNILHVALEAGYQSEAHFSKAFKRHYGLSPSQYRKKQEPAENSAK
ncbi:AraC family transcriptional regulator [Pasteurellaceae bacterium LIM206]|nr:AraC family transcriptional regulator [Pasteurellaceae bacterium LIM206]